MRKISFFFLVFSFLALMGCSLAGRSAPEGKAEAQDPAEEILRSMTLAEKIGQMTMIGVLGKDMDDDIRFMLTQYHVGGVIFFDRNMESAFQMQKFVKSLQKVGGEKIPLFVAVDEEGGRVSRGKDFLKAPPAASEIGQGDLNSAKAIAADTAKRLRYLGFNVNFAPVADIGLKDRSFGDDKEQVTSFVRQTAAGFASENFIYCLKHFPGIGKGKTDTHIGMAVVDIDPAELEAEDMAPFKTLIDENKGQNFFVMVGHVNYPRLDPDYPASLSGKIQTDLLRRGLGYDGLIITDDLEMGAITERYGFKEAAVLAVEAGADVVLICHEYPHETESYLGLLSAVESGRIKESRIDESVRRILKAKLQIK